MRTESTRTVVFRESVTEQGRVIAIEFREGSEVAHTEGVGDAEYTGAIVDWILFGTYRPVAEREGWEGA